MYKEEFERWLEHDLEDPDLLPELLKVKDNDEEIKGLKDDMKMVLRSIRVLVAHGATNNEKGELKRIQNELDEYLINK